MKKEDRREGQRGKNEGGRGEDGIREEEGG